MKYNEGYYERWARQQQQNKYRSHFDEKQRRDSDEEAPHSYSSANNQNHEILCVGMFLL